MSLKSFYDGLPSLVRTTLWSAGRAFVAALLVVLPAVYVAPDVSTAKGILFSGLIAGVTAAVRVVQHVLQGTVTSP